MVQLTYMAEYDTNRQHLWTFQTLHCYCYSMKKLSTYVPFRTSLSMQLHTCNHRHTESRSHAPEINVQWKKTKEKKTSPQKTQIENLEALCFIGHDYDGQWGRSYNIKCDKKDKKFSVICFCYSRDYLSNEFLRTVF